MMKRKDNIYVGTAMFAVAIGATVSGCSRFEDDVFFDGSSSLRIEQTSEDIKDLLVSAPQGWVVQYHVGSESQGYNLFAKFDENGKVLMAGNHGYLRNGNANKYTEYTSLYELLREESIVLAFNSWNDILTPFVDPVSPSYAPTNIVPDGTGMGGDMNLVAQSWNENEIIFRGERHRSEIRFLKADRDWQDYISTTGTMKSYITNTTISNYYLVSGSDTLYYVGLRNGLFTQQERIYDPLNVSTISCCFTPTGFRNEYKATMGEHTYQEFTLAEDKSCLVSEDGGVKVIPMWDSYIVGHSAIWEFDAEKFSEEQQSLLDQISDELKKLNKSWSAKSLGLGRSTAKDPVNGLMLTYYTSKTKTNVAGLELNLSRPLFGQIGIDCTEANAIDGNLSVFTTRGAAVESLMRQFAATISGTYDMTPDNYFLPTGCTLRAVEGDKEYILK